MRTDTTELAVLRESATVTCRNSKAVREVGKLCSEKGKASGVLLVEAVRLGSGRQASYKRAYHVIGSGCILYLASSG